MLSQFAYKFQNNNSRLEDGEFVVGPRYIGKNILLYGKRSTRFPYQCMVGPDWHCMTITYLLIIIPSIIFLSYVAKHLGIAIIMVGAFLSCCTLM